MHPVPPVTVQVPVIEPPVRVVPLLSVPVTVPVRVRVLPCACTVYEKVPVTASVLPLMVKTIVPACVPPAVGKHVPSVSN